MSQLVKDSILADTATLIKEVQDPVAPFGYGTDVSCVSDFNENFDDVDPFSPIAIGEALLRRLTTARGTLPDDKNYGLDIRGYCNRPTDVSELRDIAGQIRNEVTKDDRVASATVGVTFPEPNTMTVTIRVKPEDSDKEFTLTFANTNGQVTLESIN